MNLNLPMVLAMGRFSALSAQFSMHSNSDISFSTRLVERRCHSANFISASFNNPLHALNK